MCQAPRELRTVALEDAIGVEDDGMASRWPMPPGNRSQATGFELDHQVAGSTFGGVAGSEPVGAEGPRTHHGVVRVAVDKG